MNHSRVVNKTVPFHQRPRGIRVSDVSLSVALSGLPRVALPNVAGKTWYVDRVKYSDV